ncbi:MAG: hypothetical protein ACREJ1_01905 [Candidatus Methylomirabilales bacterium]
MRLYSPHLEIGVGLEFLLPPDNQEKATQTVLEQARLLALGTEKGRESFIRAKQVKGD